MTREEAIDILFGVIAANSEEENEALDMAIEALKAKTDGDLISRQDAIDALGEEPPVWYDGDDEIAERNQWRRDKAAIESLPSAEPKTGKWKSTTSGDHYKCSVCGYRAGYWFNEENSCEYSMDMSEWLSNFCPNCGAKMKGADDEREDIQSTDE